MLLSHNDKRPTIDPAASIAPTAVICGDVTIGPGTRIGFGAVVTAESGPVTIGAECVVMECAVLRAVQRHPLVIGDHTLIGPHAHLTGCAIGKDSFIATRATIFNGATLGERADVRVGATVQIRTVLPPATTVPIGWVAIGDPARILPPERHDDIWNVQRELNFRRTVFGVERTDDAGANLPEITRRYARMLASHDDDRAVEPPG